VLLLAALSGGTTRVHDLLDSDDTRVMLDALRALGCSVVHQGAVVEIEGLGGKHPAAHARLFLGNAGTAMRPLTAALALMGGEFEVSGVARMHERPIGDLVDALRQLGCRIDYLGNPGYPPLKIHPAPALTLGAPIQVRGDVSSQFLTALLMALPLVATLGHRDRSGRRSDLEALHRDHAQHARALRHPRRAARAGSASPSPPQAGTARPGKSTWKPTPPRRATSWRWGPWRRPTGRCASKAWAPVRSRATSVSWTRPGRWVRRSPAARTGSR
jgi:hypothetical protein